MVQPRSNRSSNLIIYVVCEAPSGMTKVADEAVGPRATGARGSHIHTWAYS